VTAVPQVWGDSTPGSSPEPAVLLYQSERTRVHRVALPAGAGTAIRKEALGSSALARTRHESAILARLAGVDGLVRPVGGPPADAHVIMVADAGGRSLADVIRSGGVGPERLLGLALRLARILAGVHGAGVMHRDLNPANVLLRDDGEPMLIDFDLATTFAELRPGFTHHREIVGRLAYLAPEQTGRTGLPVDTRADLYGLGATLYEAATGAPPFGDGDPLQLVRDILARVPRPLAEVAPGVPAALSDVVARLLEKEPERRYQSAEGLAHDLARLSEDPSAVLRLGERDFPSRLSPPSTLVGRDAEIAALRAALDGAVGGAVGGGTRGVLVAGAPGVGKSALIEQLRPMVTARGGWYVAGKFDQYRHDTAAGAVAQALAGLGRLLLAEPDEELAGQRQRIRDALGPNTGLVTAAVPEFATLLGADHPSVDGDPTETETRLRQAQVDLIRAVASPQRPIVMVLDDLQWASQATMAVIDAMQTDPALRGLLLVGAYRDGEVDAAHPLTAVMARWQRLGYAPPLLTLSNLAAADLGALLAGMLRLPPAEAAALAGAVGERTAGNPYDTVELVNALRRDGALVLGETGWRWDASTIRRYIGQGDVVDLLKDRLDQLPAVDRRLLEVMACLGGEVGLDLLATASAYPRAAVSDLLAAALEDALLVMDNADRPGDEEVDGAVSVRFRHDRVQQAAHDGLDPAGRAAVHLSLARRLAAVPRYRAEAAQQYLAAGDAIGDDAERRLAAELFEEAAAGVARVSNHATAERYLAAATRLREALGAAPDDPALVGLETARHSALYSLGRLDEADEVYRRIERRCADPLDLVDAACIQIPSVTNRGRLADALAVGFALLGRLGFAPPGDDLAAEVDQRLDAMYRWADRMSVAEDVARPEATDPCARAAARLTRWMVPAAFFTDQTLQAWLVTEAQRLWVEYGPDAQLVPSIGTACFSTIQVRDDYGVGVRIARHILAVGEARGYEVLTGHARYLFAVSGCHWFEPVDNEIREARLAREVLLRAGDLQSTCLSYYPSIFALLDYGPTLDDLASEVEAAMAFGLRTGNERAVAVHVVYRQFVRAMTGQTATPGGFADASFDEDRHAAINPRLAAHVYVYRALSAALFDDPDGLVGYAETAVRYAPLLKSLIPSVVFHLVQAVALAQRARTAPPEERSSPLAEVDRCRDWLAARAADAPENFRHLVHLVDAERAWAVDDFRGAAAAFDIALREVQPRQRPWHRALIAERTGLFYLAYGIDQVGRGLLAEARQRYQAWGAAGKVQEMDRAHPFLRRTAPIATVDQAGPALDHRHSSSVRTDDIDMLAILRASQALSSETSLDRLYGGVAEQMRALTGATTVTLLVHDDDLDDWVMPAVGGRATPLPVAQAATQGLLPLAAFRYAERTREPLLVEDAIRDDRFARDPYLAGVDRCSLLVVPIVKQGVLRAVLLLENRLSSGAFSADRLDTVLLIAGQLAVSLDNALLYRRLEDKVAERTRELQAANEQLETLSLTDALTGLANRRRFDEVLATTWRQAGRAGTHLAIAMIDIDHFKWFNDDYGHPAGDACLRAVAAALADTIRHNTDLVCRYGGEEFAVIFAGADGTRAGAAAERARAAVAGLARTHARTTAGVVTLSVGVAATVPALEQSADSLVKAADTALYQAKENGRNQIVVAGAPT
jgi:diguanylate cyclase (GGDEF)-like protein